MRIIVDADPDKMTDEQKDALNKVISAFKRIAFSLDGYEKVIEKLKEKEQRSSDEHKT